MFRIQTHSDHRARLHLALRAHESGPAVWRPARTLPCRLHHRVLYEVDQSRDGRSFTTRRVVAIQNGKQILNLAASFQVKEDGFEHQAKMPEIKGPETLPSSWEGQLELAKELPEEIAKSFRAEPPIDVRPVEPQNLAHPKVMKPENHVWIRLKKTIDPNPILHQVVLAYASDMTLLDTAARAHGVNFFKGSQMGSLDHAIWFHEPFRTDDWMLYAQDSPKASGGRGFTRGSIYTKDGTLVASVAQEGLIRPIRKS